MNNIHKVFKNVREKAYKDLELFQLKAIIILWALFVIVLVIMINNKWILAGILAYEVLP